MTSVREMERTKKGKAVEDDDDDEKRGGNEAIVWVSSWFWLLPSFLFSLFAFFKVDSSAQKAWVNLLCFWRNM